MPTTLADWLAYLERLHPKSIALGLERAGEVARRLDLRPAFPVITVAGTNGKGSTCAMLENIYRAAGYHAGCYSSPHLLRYNERVRINGAEAADDALCRAFAAVEAARGDIPLTYFEFGTLAAMCLFIENKTQVAILEVGLGGRLDAVNVFDPTCAILTSVDLDHVDYLGATREHIGHEKAGIFRAHVPAVCGEPQSPASVLTHAREIAADYRQIGRDFHFEKHGGGWDFVSDDTRVPDLPLPALSGEFQLSNASCALEAICRLQTVLPVSAQAMRDGLSHAVLPGRFQVFAGSPEIILDVAHNPHAARGLAQNLRASAKGKRTLAVFAMLADKDIPGVLREVAGEIALWFMADIHETRGASAELLARHLAEVAPAAGVRRFPDVVSAFRAACETAEENDRIAAFGSFYTVADVLRALSGHQPAA
ncbi:MAG: bifunctional tetrahydrofolate synthase/dihydrofolate synthase [Methylobacillus sp.]|jgi:dihydrofolate synthase/folylpolyglutamate synthase|nr:bifunctional tetrahydrofolate synthase/dihydrofolate synthase [Methylobacillus sp.]